MDTNQFRGSNPQNTNGNLISCMLKDISHRTCVGEEELFKKDRKTMVRSGHLPAVAIADRTRPHLLSMSRCGQRWRAWELLQLAASKDATAGPNPRGWGSQDVRAATGGELCASQRDNVLKYTATGMNPSRRRDALTRGRRGPGATMTRHRSGLHCGLICGRSEMLPRRRRTIFFLYALERKTYFRF
jgi:hypothetical protein